MYGISFYQNTLTIVIFIISYIIVCLVGCRKKSDVATITAIFLWHTLFSIVYYLYTLSNAADAKLYYTHSIAGYRNEFYPGSPFVNLFSSLFSQGLDASYLNTTLQYNLVGTLGLIFFYLSIKKYLHIFSWHWILILFIPSMSFWSAGLGKDAISFLATCLFLYAVTNEKKSFLSIAIAFFLMFMVRPHIAALILVSYIIYFIIQARVNIVLKAILLPIIALGVFSSIGFVQSYAGLEDSSLTGVSDYIDERQGYNQGGGSSLDISSMSYPMQMFTYIFRPLPFEAHSIVALVASIENTILLFSFVYILLKSKFNYRPFFKDKNLWLFMYVFLTCTILALTTSNLGIAARQKWMFMPVLIYLLVFSFYQYRTHSKRATP